MFCFPSIDRDGSSGGTGMVDMIVLRPPFFGVLGEGERIGGNTSISMVSLPLVGFCDTPKERRTERGRAGSTQNKNEK